MPCITIVYNQLKELSEIVHPYGAEVLQNINFSTQHYA